jgi:hypothetical protein
MRNFVLLMFALVITLALCLTPTKAQSSNKTLDIDPIFQETPEWCWVATGQMIFEYFNIPMINSVDGQCGIVSLWGSQPDPLTGKLWGPCLANCRACPFPAGQVQTILAMLQQYPVMAGAFYGRQIVPLSFQASHFPLSKQRVTDEIDADRPILVGISPSGPAVFGPQHVALIVGYETDDNDNLFLVVNDPFPFAFFAQQGMPDPYVQAGGENTDSGRYRIKYENFKTRLQWTESIHHLHH